MTSMRKDFDFEIGAHVGKKMIVFVWKHMFDLLSLHCPHSSLWISYSG